jgi:hypothetical protein
MDAFHDHLANEKRKIAAVLKDCHEMSPLAAEEREQCDRASSCSNGREAFTKDNYKVGHHNHRTGKFVGALCLGSNELLFAKRIFFYEWFDSFEKFDRTELPPKDVFYSQMNKEGITNDEYSAPKTFGPLSIAKPARITTTCISRPMPFSFPTCSRISETFPWLTTVSIPLTT